MGCGTSDEISLCFEAISPLPASHVCPAMDSSRALRLASRLMPRIIDFCTSRRGVRLQSPHELLSDHIYPSSLLTCSRGLDSLDASHGSEKAAKGSAAALFLARALVTTIPNALIIIEVWRSFLIGIHMPMPWCCTDFIEWSGSTLDETELRSKWQILHRKFVFNDHHCIISMKCSIWHCLAARQHHWLVNDSPFQLSTSNVCMIVSLHSVLK